MLRSPTEQIMVDDLHIDQFSFRRFLKFVGPGVLVSIAYLDPGNSMWISPSLFLSPILLFASGLLGNGLAWLAERLTRKGISLFEVALER